MECRILTVVLLVLAYHQYTTAHVHMAVASLEKLWIAESSIITSFEQILQQLEDQILSVSKFVADTEVLIANKENSSHETPLSTLNSLRRISLDWADSESLLLSNDMNIDEIIQEIMNETSIEVSHENLLGAAMGLERLQFTYLLKTADIAAGILQGKQMSPPMSANDCYNVGLYLLKAKKYNYANQWLLHAKHLLDHDVNSTLIKEFPVLLEETVLTTLVESLIKSDNIRLAAKINKKLSKFSEKVAKENLNIINNALHNKRLYIPNFDNWKLNRDNVEVCSGEVSQTPREQRHLRCRYVCYIKPNCIISPFRLEEHNLDPFVGVFQNVIYESEMEYIKSTSINELERSSVIDVGELSINDIRTSQTNWMDIDNHPILHKFKSRMMQITGLSLDYAEPLQVVNYGIGGHYKAHHDFLGNFTDDFVEIGDRILTALFYLNDVELGGATAFTKLKIAVHPKKGSALLWYNLQKDLSPDYRTFHSGCPVLKGSKWITNQWFHAFGQEFNRPCELKPNPDTLNAYTYI